MEIKLTREDVLIIYKFLKKLNLKFANKESTIAIVNNLIKIKDAAQEIIKENKKIINALQNDEFREKEKQYIEAKKNYHESSKGSKSALDFKKIENEYRHLCENFLDAYTKAILELDQEFIFDLKKIKLEDIVDILNKSGIDYTFENISMLYKIIK